MNSYCHLVLILYTMYMKRNTPKKGAVRVIIFKDTKENQWYGVGLEFNIVVSADTAQEVQYELSEAMSGYIEAHREIKGLRDFSALNQKADDKYEKLWTTLQDNKRIPSPYQVNFYGVKRINA